MKKRHVVVSTLSENVFEGAADKIEEMGGHIEEKRYDLLYHRYEIYAILDIWQSYKLRNFIKSYEATILEIGS